MNYVIVQNDQVPETVVPPFKIIQAVNDDELMAFSLWLQEKLNEEDFMFVDVKAQRGAQTIMHLLGQWENESA